MPKCILSGQVKSNFTQDQADGLYVPLSRTINGQSLNNNVILDADDVSAVPITRMINGQALSSDITLTAENISARPDTWIPKSRRPAKVVVGLASRYTAEECDYLCDGEDDDVEINAALSQINYLGGSVLLLDGTYLY